MNMIKRDSKPAMVTVELAVSVVLVAVVLFVTLGLFGDNLNTMFSAGHFKNIFNSNSTKTTFTSYGRGYDDSSSQVEVQLLGEQGLSMIRKKANNTSLSILNSELSNKTGNVIKDVTKEGTLIY